MSPQQWEIRSIKFVKSRVLERLSFFELLLILFDKGKICEKVFFLTNDVRERRGDYFFFKGFVVVCKVEKVFTCSFPRNRAV